MEIYAQATDEALVSLVLKGDAQAFTPLVERHKRGILNFVHASTRSMEDAGDLSQETFMRAYAHLRTFDPRLGKFSTWLYQIARNVARTHAGKESRRPRQEDLYEDETIEQRIPEERRNAAPESALVAADEQRRVRDALAHVPERMRTALALRYFQHMDYQEIAGTMQVSLGNVKTLLHRGKASLAAELRRFAALDAVKEQRQAEVARELLCL